MRGALLRGPKGPCNYPEFGGLRLIVLSCLVCHVSSLEKLVSELYTTGVV